MAPLSIPPGFRFHPTDEELVTYYLKRKVHRWKIELDIIPEVDLYKCEPWDLPAKSFLPGGDLEWYFFCLNDRKYPNGLRTNRATEAGYWKATGKDRKVCSHMRPIGMKKTLVFHRGRAPYGCRTDWVMHEYRLGEDQFEASASFQEAYALCRVFKKSGGRPRVGVQYSALVEDDMSCGKGNSFNKRMLLSEEAQWEEKSSPLSDGEKDDQNNSRATSSEIIIDTNVDDGVSKGTLQSASYDGATWNFRSLNEFIGHPKVEQDATSLSPFKVGDFPHRKNCLSLCDSRMLSANLLGDHDHSSEKEAVILEPQFRDTQTCQGNNSLSQFISSDAADIRRNEDYVQRDDFVPGWNIQNDRKKPSNSSEEEEADLFLLNNFLSQEYNLEGFNDYNSESFYDQPEQLLFFNRFLRQNSNPESLACMLT